MNRLLTKPWVQSITAIYSSCEQKSIDGATILADHLDTTFTTIEQLGENDRSSTGFLAPEEFETTADAFFHSPNNSIRGWETATCAQQRIVQCITKINQQDTNSGPIAVVSHGAVGTLLYCHLTNQKIDRRWDQPGNGGGNYLTVNLTEQPGCSWWQPID